MGYSRPFEPWMVTNWTASASTSSRRRRESLRLPSSIASRSHASRPGDAETLLLAGAVQQLADVGEVGEQPLAARLGQHPRASPAALAALCTAATPAAAEQVEPAADALGEVVGQVVAAGDQLLGGGREERRECGGADPAGQLRLLHRLEQPQPVGRGRAEHHALGGVDHRRDAADGAARAWIRGASSFTECSSTAKSPGRQRPRRRAVGAAVELAGDVGRRGRRRCGRAPCRC